MRVFSSRSRTVAGSRQQPWNAVAGLLLHLGRSVGRGFFWFGRIFPLQAAKRANQRFLRSLPRLAVRSVFDFLESARYPPLAYIMRSSPNYSLERTRTSRSGHSEFVGHWRLVRAAQPERSVPR